jgi:adenine deaminase
MVQGERILSIHMMKEEHDLLIEVVMGRKAPTLLIRGGEVLNVYTGQVLRQDVALAGSRIAYVGELEQSGLRLEDDVPVLDVSGQILVPGYIEPHAHPFQLYNPVTLAEKAGALGTTTLISDNLNFFVAFKPKKFIQLMEKLAKLKVRMFWWARLDGQTYLPEEQRDLFSVPCVEEVLGHPQVLQVGELTDWIPLLAGDKGMKQLICQAKNLGKRVEAHAPGASYRTLARLAAAGVTGDHESITFDEVWRRLQLGYFVTLRHSSIRPDLPVLLEGLLKEKEVPWHRLTMTTDGATPLYFKNGFTDYLIQTALDCGCSPIHAYQMVTINPAVYYRLDDHLGGIAPGRLANINVLSSLTEPRPILVLADGEILAREGKCLRPLIGAEAFSDSKAPQSSGRYSEEDFRIHGRGGASFPVMHLINSVITKNEQEEVPLSLDGTLPADDDLLYAFLVDRLGKWKTPGLVRGFGRGIDGLASSYTGSSQGILVLGRSPEAMAQAVNRVLQSGGGIFWVQGDEEIFSLPLPILGTMNTDSLDQLIAKLEPFAQRLKNHGFTYLDPLYTLLFLSSTHLPQLRLTSEGLMSVKDKRILVPAEKR